MTEMSARAKAIFIRTYSRPKEGGGYETYEEVMERVTGHQRWLWERSLGRALDPREEAELGALKALFLARKCMPAGRTLWLGGTEIARSREISQFNCSGLVVKTIHDVVDVAWLLLNGAGVGAKPTQGVLNGFARPIDDVRVIRSERTEKGGEEHNTETFDRETGVWTIRVGDSGEAWAKAVGKLLGGKWAARSLVLDFSQIRPEGSLLARYGWRSSGDSVISVEMVKMASLLSRRAGQLLSKLDIADIVNHLGVIQTGRRGAEILLMDSDDPEADAFAAFKARYWERPETHHRAQSNNSLVFSDRPSRTRLREIFDEMMSNGGNEPGFINGEAARARAPWFYTVNPCAEILLADRGLCNLTETSVAAFDRMDDLLEALRLIARANYRQTLVELDDGILQRSWHENQAFLRLCGVSLTGVAQRPDHTAHDLRMMRNAAVSGAWAMADELGTPRPKNVTCVKPSGTLGKVMDAAEGAHVPPGRHIINSVVYARTDPLVGRLREAGYRVRPHPTAETQVLVAFPVEFSGGHFTPEPGPTGGTMWVNRETALAQLRRYRLLQENFSDQNVSLTVSYTPDEVDGVCDWLYANWGGYVGVAWMLRMDPATTPESVGAPYLPQQVVTQEAYAEYIAELREVDWEDAGGAVEENDALDPDCEGGVCPVR